MNIDRELCENKGSCNL